MKDYIQQALRTNSDKFYPEKVDHFALEAALVKFANVAETLDKAKKAMFYGKDENDLPPVINRFELPAGCSTDMFHAIIGTLTEAGELAEAVLNAYSGVKPIDMVNVAEEFGDIFWYAAIGANAAGKTFEEIQAKNIAKLKERFPDKFTEENAINRDLNKEREILEAGEQVCVDCGGNIFESITAVGQPDFKLCVKCNKLQTA